MQELRFLHTPAMASVCGYEHKAQVQGEEYVIAGIEHSLLPWKIYPYLYLLLYLASEQKRGNECYVHRYRTTQKWNVIKA